MLDLLTLGVGAGRTAVYDGEPSSAFLLRADGAPALLLDVGFGVTAALRRHRAALPPCIYVSHNHSDHAGELPVVLAVEAARRAATGAPRLCVLAAAAVMERLKAHRLHELLSTGEPLESFADFGALAEGEPHALGVAGLSIAPLRAAHAEVAFGLLVSQHGRPVLAWTSDSGYSEPLLRALSVAPTVLVDARASGSAEHAGSDQIVAAVEEGVLAGCSVYVYGYGRLDEAPNPKRNPRLCQAARVLRPGDVLVLDPTQAQVQPGAHGAGAAGCGVVATQAAPAAAGGGGGGGSSSREPVADAEGGEAPAMSPAVSGRVNAVSAAL